MAQTITTIRHDDTKALEYKFKPNSLINEFSKVGRLNTMCSNNKNPNNIDFFKSLVKDNVMTLDRKKQKVQEFLGQAWVAK